MLKIENIRVNYGRAEIIHGLSLEVNKGEIVTLIGGNGAGKTTTLKAVCGLVPARSGTIRFNGVEIQNDRPDQVVRRGITMIPESRQLFPYLSVRDNLIIGAYRSAARRNHLGRLEEILGLFPKLRDRLEQLAGSLSGGEQQMVAIGRGLMAKPELLIFDEPSLGLSPLLVEQLFETIQRVVSKGMTVLIVEQNILHTLSISDRGYVLENGVISVSGTGKELKDNPSVRRAYLGH